MLVESYSPHPLLNKLMPAGASHKRKGPDGAIAPVVTTGTYRKNLVTEILRQISSIFKNAAQVEKVCPLT